MRRGTLGLAILLFITTACGDSGTTNGGPAGPSSPTVTSVTVTGTLTLVNIGQTSQLSATAHFAKGTTQNVTTQATWSSSDSTIATVSPGGLVTSVAVGTATITATYQSVAGTTRVTVTRPAAYVLSGAVAESVPTTSTMLSGARVEFLDGVNQGRFATTDSSGHYQITQVPAGTFNLRATMAGYVEATRQVTVNADTTVDFGLAPTPAILSRSWFGQISGTDTACYQAYPCRVFDIAVHNTGSLNATLLWDSTSDAYLALQLYAVDSNQIVAASSGTAQPSQFVFADIRVPGNYRLRVVALTIARSISIRLNATFPN